MELTAAESTVSFGGTESSNCSGAPCRFTVSAAKVHYWLHGWPKTRLDFCKKAALDMRTLLAVRPGSMPYSQLRAFSHTAEEMALLVAGTMSRKQFAVQGVTEVKFTASS